MAKILLVEDDIELAERVKEWLNVEMHVVDVANDGDEGREFMRMYSYDVIVLDWNLPGATGIELCKEFRSKGGTTPVIMLTGRSSIEEKEQGLDIGADDYLTKPFHAKELGARLRALLRRPREIREAMIHIGTLVLDPRARKVTKNGQELALQVKEFTLLQHLMSNPNQVFGSRALLEALWDADAEASEDTVRTYIKTLRRKITTEGEECPIRTIHGLGYRFDAPEQPE